MEGISSSDRARKLFERVVDIVTNDLVQERPNSLLRTPHRDTSAALVSYPDPHRSCGWITSPLREYVIHPQLRCGSGYETSASQIGVSGSSSAATENSRLSARINSATRSIWVSEQAQR